MMLELYSSSHPTVHRLRNNLDYRSTYKNMDSVRFECR
jgi:hypothetical protein